MTGDRFIRTLTAAVVLAVAAFAAVVSYSHVYDLGRVHGQAGTAARLLPLSVDGLIAAASLVMLHEARRQRPAPRLAWWMLALGVAATLAANVLYGLPWGPVGAVVSAWPAVAFVGTVEMLMYLVRSARRAPAPANPLAAAARDIVSAHERFMSAPVSGSAPEGAPAASNGHAAALKDAADLYAADLAAGDVPSLRRIRADLKCGQDKAKRVQAHLESLTPAGQSIKQLRDEMRGEPAALTRT
jgi:Protein of unknown function (DUF2637)